ncbi:MAG TPA: YtxH domain-containing protein [Clostridiales bacterium]|nr:YtxH domain-containing protein [Clostridiales bacterium]
MGNGFTKGIIVGSLIGVSMVMAMNSGVMGSKSRRKMMKTGKRFLRRSGNIVSDIAGVFR